MVSIFAIALLGNPDPPPEFWRELPRPIKHVMAGIARDAGVHNPDQEVPSWEYFDGAVYVWRCRFTGNQLPYPYDPIHGYRQY